MSVCFAIQKNSSPFSQPDFLDKLESARNKFQLYGFNDKIKLMEEFVSALENQNVAEANSVLRKLTSLVRSRIREELGIKD